jgi:hypothetical protein
MLFITRRTVTIQVCFLFLPFFFMFLLVFGGQCVVVSLWSSRCYPCLALIMFLLSNNMLFVLTVHHVVIATKHWLCFCCYMAFIMLLLIYMFCSSCCFDTLIMLLLINIHHVVVATLHSSCCFVTWHSSC